MLLSRRVLGLVIASALASACSGGAPGKPDDGKTAVTTSPADRPAVVNDTSATKLETAGATEPEAADEMDLGGEDLNVLPPEIVSGAYLTCAQLPASTKPPQGHGYFGCATFQKDGSRLDVARSRPEFTLRDRAGKPVDAPVVGVDGRDEDVIWKVEDATLARGVAGELEVYDTDGRAASVKQDFVSSKAAEAANGYGEGQSQTQTAKPDAGGGGFDVLGGIKNGLKTGAQIYDNANSFGGQGD